MVLPEGRWQPDGRRTATLGAYAGLFDPDNPAYVDRARQDLAAAMVSTEAAHQALGSLSIDKLVSNHPVYASWGARYSTAASMGIPWDTCQGGWRRNTLRCQHNATRSFHCDDLWPRYRDRALSAGEEQELDRYLATRETNEGDFNPYWTDVDRDLGPTLRPPTTPTADLETNAVRLRQCVVGCR